MMGRGGRVSGVIFQNDVQALTEAAVGNLIYQPVLWKQS